MPRNDITKVTALVDWNSQIHAASPVQKSSPVDLCSDTLRYLGRAIGKVLNSVEADRRYDVTLRIYHGWRRGFEATARRKAMVQVFTGEDFPSLSERTNVVIRPDLNFGDCLCSALPKRLHANLACHLPNTLHYDAINKAKSEEKMVDTAIAGDLVDLAYREPERWLMVVGEDDDLVPPVFIAEGVRGRGDGRVLLVRRRPETPFLKLGELRFEP